MPQQRTVVTAARRHDARRKRGDSVHRLAVGAQALAACGACVGLFLFLFLLLLRRLLVVVQVRQHDALLLAQEGLRGGLV
jgi:hypothetical protein